MKTRLLVFTICVALFSLAASAKTKNSATLTGNSLTEFGKFIIMVSDVPMVLNNESVKTYDLKYENTLKPVKVGLVYENQCTTFVVRNNDFEIEYTCNNGVFGVKKIENRFQTMPKKELETKLNRESYFAQRVICTGKKSEEELLGLIACYFPKLVKNEYQANF